MKLLNFISRFRVLFILGISTIVFTVSVLAQPDPISAFQNLPADFQWAWFFLALAGMPIHWVKQALFKEVAWDTFDDHFFKNLQWTFAAALTLLGLVAADTEILKVQPLFSTAVIITLLSLGWNVDSGINAPLSKQKPPSEPPAQP